MATATRNVSPGAALLRASRMFSMPTPISAASGDFSSATKHHSPTATLPHPTHLAVTTPFSSRLTGDWGFKSPLPLKTTLNTTIPLVRVKQVDSTEHVTDFKSASDHTITLEKFQELHMPITVPPSDTSYNSIGAAGFNIETVKSIFEEESDVTAITEEQKETLQHKRWRFKGPWLAGMTDGDFEKYVDKEARGRRAEFRAFLRKRLAVEMTEERARKASEEASEVVPEPVFAEEVTNQQLTNYIKRLRADPISLYRIVGLFLDLAPLAKPVGYHNMIPGQNYTFYPENPYRRTGPPKTHPSAGISYLRTRNFQENHPLYGPQLKHAPVEARVVMPRHPPSGNANPVVGVGGFITRPDQNSSFNNFKSAMGKQLDRSLIEFDLETPGGVKKLTNIKDAYVDSTGRVIMRVDDAEAMAKVVQKEMMGLGNVSEDDLRGTTQYDAPPRRPTNGLLRRGTNQRMGSSSAYGMSSGLRGERDL